MTINKLRDKLKIGKMRALRTVNQENKERNNKMEINKLIKNKRHKKMSKMISSL